MAKIQLIQVDERHRNIHLGPLRHFCLFQSTSMGSNLWADPSELKVLRVTLELPELQDTCDIPCGENPPHIVEVSHIQTAIRAAGQCHWGQQLISISKAITAGAGDAAPTPIPHHTADYRRLLGDKDILPIAHVKNTWRGQNKGKQKWQVIMTF